MKKILLTLISLTFFAFADTKLSPVVSYSKEAIDIYKKSLDEHKSNTYDFKYQLDVKKATADFRGSEKGIDTAIDIIEKLNEEYSKKVSIGVAFKTYKLSNIESPGELEGELAKYEVVASDSVANLTINRISHEHRLFSKDGTKKIVVKTKPRIMNESMINIDIDFTVSEKNKTIGSASSFLLKSGEKMIISSSISKIDNTNDYLLSIATIECEIKN